MAAGVVTEPAAVVDYWPRGAAGKLAGGAGSDGGGTVAVSPLTQLAQLALAASAHLDGLQSRNNLPRRQTA